MIDTLRGLLRRRSSNLPPEPGNNEREQAIAVINFKAGIEAVISAWEREPADEIRALVYMHEGSAKDAVLQWLRTQYALFEATNG